MKKRECEKCFYYGRPADAPETVEKDCMFVPTGEGDDCNDILPCERYSDLEDLTL